MGQQDIDRLARATRSLEGLSVGDAFGETFFVNPDVVEGLIEQRALATRKWRFTDDTLMALSVFSVLRQHGRVDQDALAQSFAERYDRALQTLGEVPYTRWRDYDAEDAMRFYALGLHDAGMIKANPKQLLAEGTDWRFFNQIKRELKV